MTHLSRTALAVVLGLAATPAFAALTADETRQVDRIEEYLNGFRTLKADFNQVDAAGRTSTGTLYVARPGRLRFEYDEPSPILVIADGHWVVHYDRDLRSATHIPQSSTPAALLASSKVDLENQVEVTDLRSTGNSVDLSVVRRESPEEGRVTMHFTSDPMVLTGWTVVDQSGGQTQVELHQVVPDPSLNSSLFVFDEPTRADRRDQRP